MLNITTKTFKEFTTQELYKVLQLRTEVFVVEQDCVYQDIDNKDQNALHVIGTKNGEVVAYTRIFAPGFYFKDASIGRVVVKKSERKYGYGKVIMEASIQAIKTHFNQIKIHISAQEYLIKFYSSLGFKQVGEGYLEDNIPHIAMFKTE
ncbi:ElaA protein [Maribacter vaceletii]|uniref:ElaA protein n=1 Tax=Maribacter vaceletii TaxID=1206816 RepID=A0A495EE45_9FLAO|nr:GNAT family N-acetyltransferase [Maribacter vaceletii]RKR14823.1 ElaA protein [Maribacter vaceletii]